MGRITLQKRHMSITGRMLGEKVGSNVFAAPAQQRVATRQAKADIIDDKVAAQREIMRALYEKAKSGDNAAIRQWNELNAPESEDPFHVEIQIVPYNIADKSLPKIAQQADVPVVNEIFEGFRTRLEADNAPELLKQILRSFRLQFNEWAKVVYSPKDI